MASRYPQEQFPELQLPGFNSEATLWDIASVPSDWQSTLSLSIYSRNPENPDEIDVLTGIRTDDTETHPHVVSTPTGRFPHAFQLPLLESRRAALVGEVAPFKLNEVGLHNNRVVADFSPNLNVLPDREDPLAYLAHEQLARKLGLSEALQKTRDFRAIGTISLSEVIAGFSYAADEEGTETPLWEPLLMYAGVIMLDDRNIVPEQTKAYRKISWTSVDHFIEGQATKKSELLIPDIAPADEATVCVRGLCLTTTSTVSHSADLKGHLGLVTH